MLLVSSRYFRFQEVKYKIKILLPGLNILESDSPVTMGVPFLLKSYVGKLQFFNRIV